MYCSHDQNFMYLGMMLQCPRVLPLRAYMYFYVKMSLLLIFAPLVPMHLGVTGHEIANAVFRVQLCVTALHVYTKTYTNSTLVQSFLHH